MSNGLFVTFPVAGYSTKNITSFFGKRDTANLPKGASSYHEGIDIAAPAGTGVLAALSGKVSYTGNSSAKGNYIIVDHGNGVQSEYAHLNNIGVRGGQSVVAGTQIGTVGSTGISSGNHLDFRIKVNGSYVDPTTYKPTAAQTGNAGLNGLLAGIGAGGQQMNNINIDGIIDAIKQNWYLVAGGILVIAILTR